MPLFVVHYSEIALKGRNRPEFIRALRHNLATALSGLSPGIALKDGRFLVSVDGDPDAVEERLSKVFGVSWFSKVASVPRDYSAISNEVMTQSRAASGSTFRISPHRSDKTFPMRSSELARRLGSEVVRGTPMKVSLTGPDLDLHVDIIRSEALIYSKRRNGLGGLPVGTAGRAIHLFSGGIDSPVAAWLLMKRGCKPVYAHFYLAPSPQYAIQSKVTKLVKILSRYMGRSTLVLIPFAEYQLATSGMSGGIEPSLFRRFMRMTAEHLAPKFRAGALSTGDSLSQAASQTLWNLGAFDEGTRLPVLRPLLTYDKEEIVSLARTLGTYDVSLEEYKDCCAIITRHPQTRTKPEVITRLARELDFDSLVSRSLKGGTLLSWDPTRGDMKTRPLLQALEDKSRETATESDSGPGVPETPAVESKL